MVSTGTLQNLNKTCKNKDILNNQNDVSDGYSIVVN